MKRETDYRINLWIYQHMLPLSSENQIWSFWVFFFRCTEWLNVPLWIEILVFLKLNKPFTNTLLSGGKKAENWAVFSSSWKVGVLEIHGFPVITAKCCFDDNSFTILKVCKLILTDKSMIRTWKLKNVPETFVWIKLECDS